MALSKSLYNFTWNAYQMISATSADFVFSPLSAHMGLIALQAGAVDKTLNDLKQILCLDDSLTNFEEYRNIFTQLTNVEEVKIKLASKIYAKDSCTFHKEFEDIMKSFPMEFDSVNFLNPLEASETINQWIDEKTKGIITRAILPRDINFDTLVVLINTVYFKGKWSQNFNPKLTRTVPFYTNQFESSDVQMMYSHHMYYYVKNQDLDAKVLVMSYVGRQVEMMIILPNNKDGIGTLGIKLKGVDLEMLRNSMYIAMVTVGLPKFSISQETDLKQLLKQMGCESLFLPGECNLSKMLQPSQNLFISRAFQKIVIDVSEQGTEAAAFTGYVSRQYAAYKTKRRNFIADHPFIILITYKAETGLIPLFIGRIMHPTYPHGSPAPRGSPIKVAPVPSEDEVEKHHKKK